MVSFKVICPSCEATVTIKNLNLLGTKIECPKCKYRFRVEEQAAGAADAGEKGDTNAADSDITDKNKTTAKSKLVPFVVAGIALVLLVGVGIVVLGGGDTKRFGFGRGKKTNPPPEEPTPPGNDIKTKGPETTPEIGINMTYLLPANTVAVRRLNLTRAQQSPLYGQIVDEQFKAQFQAAFGFPLTTVDTYIACGVGEDREPFGIFKLKSTVPTTLPVQGEPKKIKKWNLYEIRPNLFLPALAQAFSFQSMFSDLYDKPPPTPPTTGPTRPMGLCVYDNQHLLVGDYAVLELFITTLDEKSGYPPFRTLAPGSPIPTGTKKDDVAYDPINAYRTLDYPLKRALDELEADRTAQPMYVVAERFDTRWYDPKLMKQPDLVATLDPVANRTRYLSASVVEFSGRRLFAHIRITTDSAEQAQEAARNYLAPWLSGMVELLKLLFTAPVEFRDRTLPSGMTPGTGLGPGTGPGIGPGPGLGPPGSSTQPPREEQPPVPGTGYPYDPTMPGVPGVGTPSQPQPTAASFIDLSSSGNQIAITADLSWTIPIFDAVVRPRLSNFANQIKGKLAVYGSEGSAHVVAMAGPNLVAAMPKDLKAFPRGTAHRPILGGGRFGLDYPPWQRVSGFVDLLPYLDRRHESLQASVNKTLAWYDPQNLPAASAWVPELLVPYYPQSAWRATSPYAPDTVMGATNYAFMAGRGLDIARQNPTSDLYKTKVGITGYGWGSKVDEVTDGLSNTIYLIQTPPGLQQPWIAGGGATVRGFDETDPMFGYRYRHPDSRGGTREGTYVLMADGSVRWIDAQIDKEVLLGMSTRAGGEKLPELNTVAPRLNPKGSTPQKSDAKKKPADPAPDPKKSPSPKPDPAPPPKEK